MLGDVLFEEVECAEHLALIGEKMALADMGDAVQRLKNIQVARVCQFFNQLLQAFEEIAERLRGAEPEIIDRHEGAYLQTHKKTAQGTHLDEGIGIGGVVDNDLLGQVDFPDLFLGCRVCLSDGHFQKLHPTLSDGDGLCHFLHERLLLNDIITHENLMGNGNWNTRTVARILHAQVYTGDLVQGRTKIVDHQQVEASEMEWTVVHDTHEAIISHELFETVQKKMGETAQHCKEREVQAYSPNILKGKIFCAHCGGSLHRHRNIRKKSADVYNYYCLTNSRVGKKRCPGVLIREEILLDSLADMLQNALETALGSYSLSLVELPQQTAERIDLKGKIASRKQEIQRLNGLIRSLYENLIQGILSKEEYITYKGKYESRIQQLTEEVAHLEKGLKALDKRIAQYRSLKRDSDDLRENQELTAALIDRLIDRIEITKDKQITVRYRFESEFDSNEEVLNQCKNM